MKAPSITPKLYRMRDLYQSYTAKLLKENPEYWGKYSKSRKVKNFWIYNKQRGVTIEIINYDRWQDIIKTAMSEAKKLITDGEDYLLGHNLGRIKPKHIERNYRKPQVNWSETQKLPKITHSTTGNPVPERFVYYLDDSYVRIGWTKVGKLTNERVYEFKPSRGKGGFKTAFSKANKDNPLLKLRYKFYPYIYKPDINQTA